MRHYMAADLHCIVCLQAQSLKNEVGKNIPNAGDAKRAVDKNTPNLPKLGGGLPGTNQGKGGLNIPRNS